MDICLRQKPFPYLLIRNFYDENELALIWQELDFLTHKRKFNTPDKTGQANPYMKHNSGIFLDEVYTDRCYSNILNVNRKVASAPVMKAFAGLHELNTGVFCVNHDTTLLSYYEEGGHYKPHRDVAYVTALSWFFREPKAWTGGEFIFTDHKEEVSVENNSLILFPSCVHHEVTPVKMISEVKPLSGHGRYTISQFFSTR